jgi:hypothetical protein
MVQCLEEGDEARQLDLCRWVNANCQLIPFILFTYELNFTHDGINNARNSHWWSDKNPRHCGRKFSTFLLSKCVVRCDWQPIEWACCGSESSYRAHTCGLQNELPLLLEEVPLSKRIHMVFHHEGALAHYSRMVISSKSKIPWTMDRLRWSYSQATEVPRLYSFRCLSVGIDGKRSLQIKSKHDKLVARIMNSAALLKQECRDTTSGELHVLLSRELECALKSMVVFLNTLNCCNLLRSFTLPINAINKYLSSLHTFCKAFYAWHSNSCISTPTENWIHVYMTLFIQNSPYYNLLKYSLFLLKHAGGVCVCVCIYIYIYIFILYTHTLETDCWVVSKHQLLGDIGRTEVWSI